MCGRYVVFSEKENREIMSIINEVNEKYGYNTAMKTGEIYPTNIAPIIAANENEIEPIAMTWGFPNFNSSGVIINARAETAAEKRTFKDALYTRRCVIPSTGFYEWKHEEGKKKKDKYLFLLPDSPVLYMAGFYSIYEGIKRFVILTTDANDSMKEIHDRMPVVLKKDIVQPWINSTDTAMDILNATPPELVKKLA